MIHPAIRDLLLDQARHPAFQQTIQSIRPGSEVSLSGLTLTAKALYLVLLRQITERKLLIVVDGNKEAEALYEAVSTFHDLLNDAGGHGPLLLPALDTLPGQGISPHAEIQEQRALGLWRLASEPVPIAILPVAAALLRLEPPEHYRQLAVSLKVGDEIPLDELAAHLESIGYERREPVEMVGEYSVRGGILDVFSPENARPVRIDLFGDQVDSIRRFEVESQRSVSKIEHCLLLPLRESQRSASLLAELHEKALAAGVHPRDLPVPGEPFAGWETLVGMARPRDRSVADLAGGSLLVWDEPEAIKGAAERLWKRLSAMTDWEPGAAYFNWEQLAERAAAAPKLALRELAMGLEGHDIASRPSLSFQGNVPVAINEARTLVEKGLKVAFFTATTGEMERLADVFQEYSLPHQIALEQGGSPSQYLAERAYLAGSVASVYLVRGRIRRGTVLRDSGLAIVGFEDLFESADPGGGGPIHKGHLATFSADQLDLKPGDYVVHTEHGVAQFLGLREIAQGGNRGDYMLLEFAGGSKLYVPLARMDLVQRYRGAGEGSAPALDRMGGGTWQRTKTKVRAKMRDMAEELIRLYAQRRMAEGFSYSADSNWQREFEDAFEFTETKDQLQAVQEIKRDMEKPVPMDRLLCGDVGFGKTEVVMRAAFKALGDGKQVAVLAPTTVLAFQHFETFKRRFQPFPVRIEMLSRFRTAKELKAAVDDLGEGKVDIAIGTHRLLSKDVQFKDLGLVIVDEEQRFGVKHKETLKQMKQAVDVISMSATPIPRTLHMSLLGLRDMSVIETPPKDRLAIQTVVAPFDNKLIQSAIELELARGGQVYFLHNKVDSIFMRAASIQDLVPQARIGVGHGQMPEAELERTMLRFMRREYDIFVCTTIIENGLDIPLANTIIIENAERHGLSELYQLRGRVGRSNRRAYAYLLVPPDTELTEIARKRLAALKEFSDLGAGFKIAALDLELRGAGNLLGGEQHGHINAVGFDMYVRMLDETVRELKGEEVLPEVHSTLALGLDVRIPPEYITDENQRLRAYRSIANAADEDARRKVGQELEDRYGPLPPDVVNLLEYSAVKTAAERLGIERVERRHSLLSLKFHQESRVDPARLMEVVSHTRGAQFTPAGVLMLPLDGVAEPAAVLAGLKDYLGLLQGAEAR